MHELRNAQITYTYMKRHAWCLPTSPFWGRNVTRRHIRRIVLAETLRWGKPHRWCIPFASPHWPSRGVSVLLLTNLLPPPPLHALAKHGAAAGECPNQGLFMTVRASHTQQLQRQVVTMY
jgi:hypothetical protein